MVDIIVGPTDCNEDRDVRNVWIATLISNIKSENLLDQRTGGAIHSALIFFREAIGCYQNGAFVACISMCGSAIENLLLDLMLFDEKECTQDTVTGSHSWSVRQEFWNGQYRNYFRELVVPPNGHYNKRADILRNLKSASLLDENKERTINEILDLRDQSMHYTENTWRRFFKGITNQSIYSDHFWPFNKSTAEKTMKNALEILSYASQLFVKKI